MNILNNIKLATQKAFYKKIKALTIILPVTLLAILIILLNSEASSLVTVMQDKVFKVIDNQLNIVEITKATNNTQQGPRGFGTQTQIDDQYYQADLDKITALPEVEKAQLVESLPLNRIIISEIAGVKDIAINALSGINSTFAKNYTNNDFEYIEGQPIPIILSSNDLVETYTDWQGKDTIAVTMQRPSQQATSTINPFQSLNDANPIKTRNLTYITSDLIGKEIIVNIGGLSPISEVNRTSNQGTITFSKITTDQLTTKLADRKTSIETYWDYDKISTPQTYTFKVVGIAESGTQFRTYIPEAAVPIIMNAYYANYTSARNATPFTENIARSFTGALYDGTNIKYDNSLFSEALFAGFRNQLNNIDSQQQAQSSTGIFQPGQQFQRIEINGPRGIDSSISIPGLVYNYDTTTSSLGTDVQIETANRYYATQTISIKLKDGNDRDKFFSEMTAAGFTIKDTSRAADFQIVKNNLSNWINWIIIVSIILISLFVAVIISKFISDSKKEYGIMRALGMNKAGVFFQAFLQVIIQLVIGIFIGAISSVGLIYLISGIMANESQDLINLILGKTTNLISNVQSSSFITIIIDRSMIMLIIVTFIFLILSLLSANSATKVSPVRAIRE